MGGLPHSPVTRWWSWSWLLYEVLWSWWSCIGWVAALPCYKVVVVVVVVVRAVVVCPHSCGCHCGRSLSLCWVGCRACLLVGSLPSSRSGGGGCSLVLIVVVGWQQWWVAVVVSQMKMTNDESDSSFVIWLPRRHRRHGT